MTITPEQCRAARGLLDWSQSDLAEASGIGESTINRFERMTRKPYPNTRKTLRAALEAAGIVFIDDDDTVGAVLRRRDPEGN